MTAELIIAPEAQQDLHEAFGWYERQRPGLGEEFLACVEARIHAIHRLPEQHARVHREYRRALVRRFPYAVFYEYTGQKILVYGIFHTSRNPEKWKSRLP